MSADDRQKDLLLPALDQIIDMGHPLVRLAALIDWKFLDADFTDREHRFRAIVSTEFRRS
ncbi:hypothetical protein [Bradyrhizobium diazoefficiens]|uniref:hypothetical protein n=1 Tax=Bradyrhizobium diazoefficiens TaxID=1355477 RepID=UPI0027296E64|nr:hypothetical protein [Bradyrhizobium diazoefficiens]WLA66597.1 hypothetical protein QNN01_07450 [Bradyrhizobium diazoefficiens]